MKPALQTQVRVSGRGLRSLALIYLLLTLPVVLTALGAANLPYELALVDQRLPVVFRLHMLASGLALLLIPAAVGCHGRGIL